MTSYTPAEFAERYHAIPVMDDGLGIATRLDIQNYISGWKPENNVEYYRLLGALAIKMKLKGPGSVRALSQPFNITGFPDQISPAEEWYDPSISRAYAGRASPDEIADAVRLAVFCGLTTRNKQTISAQAYGQAWFGLDCNAFVGNWLGISPSSSIFSYGLGYGRGGNLLGATPDVYTTRNRLPLVPIDDPGDLVQGNVICTFGEKDSRGFRWRHIALLQDIEPVQGDDYNIWTAEWGTKGNVEKHRTPLTTPRRVKITAGKYCAELPGKTIAAFDGLDPQSKPAKRLFFDHSSLDDLPNRGWHVGGVYGT